MTFVDQSRPTPANGAVPGHPGRTLPTIVWYPAAGGSGAAPVANAAPARRQGPYPLIVFAHGFGTGPDLGSYPPLLQAWARRGYVVAVPVFPLTRSDAPGGPDAADYLNQPADVSFVITQLLAASAAATGPLSGLIDAHKVGAAGHSLGGVTTLGLVANTCCADRRITAAVVMSGDPLVFPTGRVDYSQAPPLLLVHGDADMAVPYVSSIAAFNAASPPKGLLTLRGGGHDSPVDAAGAAFAAVVRTTSDFFDRYLRADGRAGGRLAADGSSAVTKIAIAETPGVQVTLPTPTTLPSTLHATVTPQTGLHDGEVVGVTWRGFKPGVSVNVLECAKNPPTGPGDCALQTADLLRPDPLGSGSASLTVHTAVPGSGPCTPAPAACVVVVNEGGSADLTASVILPIAFAS